MADMMSLDDLVNGAASAEGVNKRAKLMRSMQAQAQALRRVGFEPMEIDLLLRGRHGMLRPNEEEAFAAVMRKLALIGRAQAVPGLTKNLRAYPPAGGSPDTSGADAMRGLGFGGGGMQSLDELMR